MLWEERVPNLGGTWGIEDEGFLFLKNDFFNENQDA